MLPPTVVVVRKLRSLNEHHCDFAKLLPAVRAVRERLDWDHIRARTPITITRPRSSCWPTGSASPAEGSVIPQFGDQLVFRQA